MLRHFNRIQIFATLRTVAFQAPLSVRFSTQDYGSGLPCPPPGDLPNPGTKPESLMSLQCQVGSLPLAPSVNPHLGIRKLQNHQSRKLVWGQGMLEKVTKKSMPHTPHDGQTWQTDTTATVISDYLTLSHF